MIQSLSNLVVRIADLMEAEGRIARAELFRVLRAGLLYGIASVLIMSGIIAFSVGIYLALAEVMHRGAALMVVGVMLLGGSFLIVIWAHRHETRVSSGE